MDSGWIADNAEKGGIIGVLAFNIVVMLKGWVITRETHLAIVEPLQKERDSLRAALDEANARDRAKLERTEAMLDALHGRKQQQ